MKQSQSLQRLRTNEVETLAETLPKTFAEAPTFAKVLCQVSLRSNKGAAFGGLIKALHSWKTKNLLYYLYNIYT